MNAVRLPSGDGTSSRVAAPPRPPPSPRSSAARQAGRSHALFAPFSAVTMNASAPFSVVVRYQKRSRPASATHVTRPALCRTSGLVLYGMKRSARA